MSKGSRYRAEVGAHNVVFNFTDDLIGDLFAYSLGYWRSATKLALEVLNHAGYRDNDVYPTFFLYRHSIELLLKATYLRRAQLSIILEDEEFELYKYVYSRHSLINLCEQLDVRLNCSEWTRIKGLIREIDKLDPKSLAFRYPLTRDGSPVLPRHTVVCLESFKKDMEEVFSYLLGFYESEASSLENTAEMLEEIQQYIQENPEHDVG